MYIILLIYSLNVIYNFTHMPLSWDMKVRRNSYSPLELLWKQSEWKVVRNDRIHFKEQEGKGWKRGLDGWPGLEMEEREGERTASHCAGTPGTGRHTQDTLTHSHTDTNAHKSACFCPPLHRPELASQRAALHSCPCLWNLQPKLHSLKLSLF